VIKKSTRDLLLESGLQAIPYVGGPLATLYFGHQQELRFQRIETFYYELKESIEKLQLKLPTIETHESEELMSLIEQVNDAVEKEHIKRKLEAYKIFYMKNLLMPVTSKNYEIRKLFLDILRSMTETQMDVFLFLISKKAPIVSSTIGADGVSPELIQGSISQLKILGIINSQLHSIVMSPQSSGIHDNVAVSPLGRRFHNFCLIYPD